MKVGYRVKNVVVWQNLTLNKTYEVEDITKNVTIKITDDTGYCGGYDPRLFELVEENENCPDKFEPTKSFLMKHKHEYLVRRRVRDFLNIGDLINVAENLENSVGRREFDIMTIYKWENGNLMLVWEREELPEMTIEEAQEKFKFRLKGEK